MEARGDGEVSRRLPLWIRLELRRPELDWGWRA